MFISRLFYLYLKSYFSSLRIMKSCAEFEGQFVNFSTQSLLHLEYKVFCCVRLFLFGLLILKDITIQVLISVDYFP